MGFRFQRRSYVRQHVNESIVVIDAESGQAVREYFGGYGRLEKISESLRPGLYAVYVGDYLGQFNAYLAQKKKF